MRPANQDLVAAYVFLEVGRHEEPTGAMFLTRRSAVFKVLKALRLFFVVRAVQYCN
jgi:hypothetical protein